MEHSCIKLQIEEFLSMRANEIEDALKNRLNYLGISWDENQDLIKKYSSLKVESFDGDKSTYYFDGIPLIYVETYVSSDNYLKFIISYRRYLIDEKGLSVSDGFYTVP